MPTTASTLLTALVLVLVTGPAVHAATLRTLHVAPGGQDSADGSSAHPWRTLQRAAGAVRPGDLVVVRAGRYAGFHLERSGTVEHPIVFRARPGVVIDTPNPVRPSEGINLEGASWVVVEGFTVTGMPRAGIRSVTNHHVTIRGNVAEANGRWGIFSGFSDDLLIEGNVAARSAAEHGIYVSNSGDRPTIRGNHVWGNRACGIHMNGDLGMGGDGIISGALVEANVVHGNGRGGGSGINADGVQASRFLNNVLYDNHASGISLYRIDGAAGSRDNLIAHNTIVQAADGRWAVNVKDGSTGARVLNNVLLTLHGWRGAISVTPDSLPGFASDANALTPRFTLDDGESVVDLAAWRAATGQDAHSFAAVPGTLFADAAAGNYRLRAAAPARDAAPVLDAVSRDAFGAPRPLGPRADAGAHEYGDPATAADLVATGVSSAASVVAPGGRLAVTDTVVNRGQSPARASTPRYFLSLAGTGGTRGRLLRGTRAVPALAPGASAAGTVRVGVPAATAPGSYVVIACADQGKQVPEAVERNNCASADLPITIAP
jgi:hypothetical protein